MPISKLNEKKKLNPTEQSHRDNDCLKEKKKKKKERANKMLEPRLSGSSEKRADKKHQTN